LSPLFNPQNTLYGGNTAGAGGSYIHPPGTHPSERGPINHNFPNWNQLVRNVQPQTYYPSHEDQGLHCPTTISNTHHHNDWNHNMFVDSLIIYGDVTLDPLYKIVHLSPGRFDVGVNDFEFVKIC
jgi:hypothetical protein